MAERTVTVCDRLIEPDTLCGATKTKKCSVCGGDFCAKHMGDSLLLRVESDRNVRAYVDLGHACQVCANERSTPATEASLKQLLDPHKEEILEILRAQQTAEALK
jgi:Fe-S cluster biogenesis protein NfuA